MTSLDFPCSACISTGAPPCPRGDARVPRSCCRCAGLLLPGHGHLGPHVRRQVLLQDRRDSDIRLRRGPRDPRRQHAALHAQRQVVQRHPGVRARGLGRQPVASQRGAPGAFQCSRARRHRAALPRFNCRADHRTAVCADAAAAASAWAPAYTDFYTGWPLPASLLNKRDLPPLSQAEGLRGVWTEGTRLGYYLQQTLVLAAVSGPIFHLDQTSGPDGSVGLVVPGLLPDLIGGRRRM